MIYNIYKDGKLIESYGKHMWVNAKQMKARLKLVQGNTLHIISGDVVNVYHNKNNRVTFSHTFIREN